MIFEYILIKNGYQGRGATVLTEMGKVESETVAGAIQAVHSAHADQVKDGENVVFVRPEELTVVTGTILT